MVAHRRQNAAIGRNHQTVDPLRMGDPPSDLAAGCDFPELHQTALAADDGTAIGREREDGRCRPLVVHRTQLADHVAGRGPQQRHPAVGAHVGQQPSVGREGKIAIVEDDFRTVKHRRQPLARRQVPHEHGTGVRRISQTVGHQEQPPVGRELRDEVSIE